MRTVLRAALLALPPLAGCESATSANPFAEPRYYSAAGSLPEGGYMVVLCPNGQAQHALGDDIVQTARYTRSGSTITLLAERRIHLVLSADEETLRYTDSAPLLRRERQYEANRCS